MNIFFSKKRRIQDQLEHLCSLWASIDLIFRHRGVAGDEGIRAEDAKPGAGWSGSHVGVGS